MLVAAWHTVPMMVILVFVCVLLGWMPDPVGMAAALLGFLLIALLGLALGLVFSVANVFMRDFGKVAQTLTQFVTFSVPMMYPYTLVQDRFGEPIASLLPLQPDGRGGAADPARLLDRHDQRPGVHRGPSTCPTTCSRAGWS